MSSYAKRTLRGDKVSVLIHTYPKKALRKINWRSAVRHQADNPLYNKLLVVWCLIWWFASIERSMVTHDTECPYWDQVFLYNTTLKLSLLYTQSVQYSLLNWWGYEDHVYIHIVGILKVFFLPLEQIFSMFVCFNLVSICYTFCIHVFESCMIMIERTEKMHSEWGSLSYINLVYNLLTDRNNTAQYNVYLSWP